MPYPLTEEEQAQLRVTAVNISRPVAIDDYTPPAFDGCRNSSKIAVQLYTWSHRDPENRFRFSLPTFDESFTEATRLKGARLVNLNFDAPPAFESFLVTPRQEADETHTYLVSQRGEILLNGGLGRFTWKKS